MDKVAETLAALARGERPPCPWCGAEVSCVGKVPEELCIWGCESCHEGSTDEECREATWRRRYRCYEREIAQLKSILEDIDEIGRNRT